MYAEPVNFLKSTFTAVFSDKSEVLLKAKMPLRKSDNSCSLSELSPENSDMSLMLESDTFSEIPHSVGGALIKCKSACGWPLITLQFARANSFLIVLQEDFAELPFQQEIVVDFHCQVFDYQL